MFNKTVCLLALLTASLTLGAQQNNLDSLSNKIEKLSSDISIFKKIKFSGYIQSQWQKAQSPGIQSFAGGNFGEDIDNRFTVRRARIKLSYVSDPVGIYIQTDFLEKGTVVRDAYGTFTFPGKLKNLKLYAGLFQRPFGFEVPYSSGSRETPERARVTQTLLPDERDVGAKLTCDLKPLKFEAGVFNGNSIAIETDSYKDFIAKVSTSHKLGDVELSGGLSYFEGGVRQGTNRVYEMDGSSLVLIDTTKSLLGKQALRRYAGADVQLGFPTPLGNAVLRGEVFTGTQPGSVKSSVSPKSASAPDYDTYIRPFNAAIFYFIQSIKDTPLKAIIKYDIYDPNRNISGKNLNAANETHTAGDIKYSTLGLGLNYYLKNITFMAYYDVVKNETSSTIAGYSKDIKDNVLTLRIQFKY